MSPLRLRPAETDPLEALFRYSARRSSPWPGRRALLALVLLVVWIGWMVAHAPRDPHTVNLLAGLPHDGLVAADNGAPHVGGDWLVTSGTLLTRDGQLWSGLPDGGPPNPVAGRTGSAVLRAVSTSSAFNDVRVRVEVHVDGLTSTSRTPEHTWDGVHLFLRYRDANNLYAVDLLRRDGVLAIKRKSTSGLAGSAAPASTSPDGGAYKTLASTHLASTRGWRTFDVSIADVSGGVQITLAFDGRQLLSTLDGDPAALSGPGRVGLRGDNAEFTVRRFDVHEQR